MTPERIWLQIGDDPDPSLLDVTWCKEKVFDSDPEYIRADVAARMVAEEREACAQIAQRMSDAALLSIEDLHAGDPVYHYHEGICEAADEIATQIDARQEGNLPSGR